MGGGNDPGFDDEIDEVDDEFLQQLSAMEEHEKLSRAEKEVNQQTVLPHSPTGCCSSQLSSQSSQEGNSSVESSSIRRTLPRFNASSTTLSSTTSSSGASRARHNDIPGSKMSKRSIARARSKLVNYRPGWFLGDKAPSFKLPQVTTLLVVGFRGSGKSALINKIIRVMEGKSANFCPAPLGRNPRKSGTNFLAEYSICKGRVSLFDTRGFTESEVVEGMSWPREWMTQGVRDGQMDLRSGDPVSVQEEVKLKGRHVDHMLSKRRDVNFVIFVVNAAEYMGKLEEADSQWMAKLRMLYENPFFSFRDDRPVLVITHTDELPRDDRVQVFAALAEHLKIPGIDQIYDLSSGSSCESIGDEEVTSVRENAIQLLTTALQRADRHLPLWSLRPFHWVDLKFYLRIVALYLILLGLIYSTVLLLRSHRSRKKWMEHAADGSFVTINLRWLGKKIRF